MRSVQGRPPVRWQPDVWDILLHGAQNGDAGSTRGAITLQHDVAAAGQGHRDAVAQPAVVPGAVAEDQVDLVGFGQPPPGC